MKAFPGYLGLQRQIPNIEKTSAYAETSETGSARTWSKTINFAVYNLGNLSRTIRVPDSAMPSGGYNCKTSQFQILTQMIKNSTNHILALCEAANLDKGLEEVPQLKHCMSSWRFVKSHCGCFAIGAREATGMDIQKIYDSTDTTSPRHQDW